MSNVIQMVMSLLKVIIALVALVFNSLSPIKRTANQSQEDRSTVYQQIMKREEKVNESRKRSFCPEENASFLSYLTYFWIIPYINFYFYFSPAILQ